MFESTFFKNFYLNKIKLVVKIYQRSPQTKLGDAGLASFFVTGPVFI
jgi:hypothetical protein